MTDEQSKAGQVPRKQTLRCACRKFPGAHALGGGGEIGLREKLNSGQSRQGLSLESQVALQRFRIQSRGMWPYTPTAACH